jgi:putative acetyltransferase
MPAKEYFENMLTISPIQLHQIADAKAVISAVAQRIYDPDQSPEEFLKTHEHVFQDVDNVQEYYDGRRGLFLVVMDDDEVVGTGAVRPLLGEIAELKRLWLLEQYHGQGIGYRVVMQLFEFARQCGYKSIRLQTGIQQVRAIAFYKKLGFVQISDVDSDDDISMEMEL